MNSISSASALQQFAVAYNYSTHGHLKAADGLLIYDQDAIETTNSSLDEITKIAIEIFKQSPSKEMKETLKIFKDYLEDRLKSFDNSSVCETNKLDNTIQSLSNSIESQELGSLSQETQFRLRFLKELPEILAVTDAPKNQKITINWLNGKITKTIVQEWEIIHWLSNRIFESETVQSACNEDERWQKYSSIMMGAYKGDHLLIQDDQEHHRTQELIALGAIMRTSSHNQKGRHISHWNGDGTAHYMGYCHDDIHTLSDVEHHFSLQGDHIKEILFYAADMRKTKDGQLIFAKTALQVDHLIQAGNLLRDGVDQEVTHYYTAFQFEYAPNCEGVQLFSINFWKHKIVASFLYNAMKWMGYEEANVGPYGYGRTDANPRLID